MAPSLVEPGDVDLDELTCYLEYALQVLEEETLKQVRTNLTMVQPSRVEYEGLANVYQAGVEKIATLVPMVLQWLKQRPIVERMEELESLSRLFLSLAEIERCMHSGGCHILSCADLLDSDTSNISVSRMVSSLVREFSFNLDLVQVSFNVLMCKHSRRHQHDDSESANALRDLSAEFLGYCTPSEYFEWCDRRCRPVLKPCFSDLGEELWEFSALVAEAAYQHQGQLPGLPGSICEPDPALVLEELSVHPNCDSLPLRIDHRDVQFGDSLGHGAYGIVWRCQFQGKDRVVKTIDLDPENLDCERVFEKEVSILASLRHPNAVQTFGFGYTEKRDQGFYVMEQMQADLKTIIRERKQPSGGSKSLVFPMDVCMDIFSQTVEGLCALRLQRVIYRDLKPANTLVNRLSEPFYRVKLADFGTSKVRDTSHSVCSTRRIGTPAYMAPEVMDASDGSVEHGYSWKVDVYSLGMVFSEVLTGEVPFRKYEGHIGKTLAAVRRGERPDLPLAAGDPLRRLIEDCWKLNPEERPDVWEVRRRLWECRVTSFFTMEKASTSWQTFCSRLESRRAIISRGETFSGVGSSFPTSGNEEREQAPVLLNSSRGALQALSLVEDVMKVALSARGRECNSECTKLVKQLSEMKRSIETRKKKLMEHQNRRLSLANVERLRRYRTELEGALRAVAGSLRKAGVGVHRCRHISIETSGLLGLFSSEVLSTYVNITEFPDNIRPGPTVMPTREQVSAAMDRIQFDPRHVHIAVCGTSGSGVSSLINALLGLRPSDPHAARVGVTQCTSAITSYRSSYLQTEWWLSDVPGAGAMASQERHVYFRDQGLFVFDAIVLVYDDRFSSSDAEIMKTSLRFNVPVFVARSKADLHIANLIRDKIGLEPDSSKYNVVYPAVAAKYVEATHAEFKAVMAAMAADPEMDLRDQQLLLEQRVYIGPSPNFPSTQVGSDQTLLHSFLSTFRPLLPTTSSPRPRKILFFLILADLEDRWICPPNMEPPVIRTGPRPRSRSRRMDYPSGFAW